MSKPKIDEVIKNLSEYYSINFIKVKKKKIFYEGINKDNKKILICSPESKIHVKGHGWTDLTEVQVDLLYKYEYSILAFRLEGNIVQFLNFNTIKSYLTETNVQNNEREGNFWRLYIWDEYLQIRGINEKIYFNKDELIKL